MTETVQKNVLESLKKELAGVELVIVTKYASVQNLEELYGLGYRDFGENRVEQFLERETYCWNKGLKDIRWHFIGHIQSKKVQKLFSFGGPHIIESIDSLKLLRRIMNTIKDKELTIFFQVNTSEEEQKSGFKTWTELKEAYDTFKKEEVNTIHLKGLMAMGHKEEEGESFQKLREIRDRLDRSLKLSMGMSGDYKKALQYGTDSVRLGTLIFKKI